MMKLSVLVGLFAAAAVSSLACSASISGNSPGGASSTQVAQCKSGCDQAKFFNCSSADGLSACYDDCNSASPAAIDKFNGCSNDSICDPSCRNLIDPPPASGSTSPTTGGGVGASDCQTACTKLITTCNLAPVGEMNDCISQCQSSGYQYQIDCVNNNQCSDIASRCGAAGGGGGTVDAGGSTDPNVFECQNSCQTLHAQSCLTSAEFTTCTNDCSSITGAPLTTFNSCVETADGSDCTAGHDCFTTFTN